MRASFTVTHGSVRTVALSTLALFASAPAAGAVQGVKLNDPLGRGLWGGTENVQCSPDGERVVFRATANTDREPLFSVPSKGGAPVELVADLPWNTPFQISPDGRLVHYLDYLDHGLHVVPIDGRRPPLRLAEDVLSFAYVPGSDEVLFSRATGIFAFPSEGGAPVPVAVPPAGKNVHGPFAISGDGRWVVFHASSPGDNGTYSAAIDGSAGPLRLDGDLEQADSFFLEITPDSQRVVYRGFESQRHGLYSVPIDASSAPVRLSSLLVLNGSLLRFQLSRDGSRVVYVADQDRRNTFELYSAPVAGGEPAIKLSAFLAVNRDVSSFQVVDGGWVVYQADEVTDGILELFLVRVTGPATPVRLNHVLPAGTGVREYAPSADGRSVVYSLSGTSLRDLFSVPIRSPGMSQRLTELVSGESTFGFAISPDSGRVAYLMTGPAFSQLYSVPIGGGARTRLDDGGDVGHPIQFTPDAQHVIYRSDRDAPGVSELFSVESDGATAPVKLNRPLDEGFVVDDVVSFQFGALGTRGTFHVNILGVGEDGEDLEELYGVQLEPRSRPALLATEERFVSVLISPDEEWVAYTVRDPNGDGTPRLWLYGVPMDGSRAPQPLIDPPTFAVLDVRFGPEGRTLFYRGRDAIGVFRVPVDSTEPPQELTGWGLDDTHSLSFQLSADGSTLVVLSDPLVEGEYELFSLPSDGSAPPVRLNDLTAPLGRSSYPFQITTDGTRVIYATDGVTDEIMELFSVPIDGSAAPMRVSGPLPAGTQVSSNFVHVPESERIVYLTRDPSALHQLWSVPADGSAPPVRLHPELPLDADATPFRVAPGGTQVVFLADLGANDVYELFVAPIDGSAPTRRLNGTLVAGGDVHEAFDFDGTGTRVVYRADEKQDEAFELFSASLVAPAAPLQLTGPHVAGGDVVGYRMVPGGRHVVFTADHDTDEVFELYIAPVDRVKGARKLGGALVEHGDVEPSFSVEAGGNVVYIADQDEDSVREVYLSSMTFLRASAPGATPRSSR